LTDGGVWSALIQAPITGVVRPLDKVPDAVFASQIVGEGFAIDPLDELIRAPFHGTVVALADTHHAVTVRSHDGVDILIHVGIDTVRLNGRGFKPLVDVGQSVSVGDSLLEFDIDLLALEATSLLTPIVVVSDHRILSAPSIMGGIKCGEALFTVMSPSSQETRIGGDGVGRSTAHISVQLQLPHGLHARPSARLAQMAKQFKGSVTISSGGKSADAASVTALMALGTTLGSEIEIRVVGDGSREAAIALADLLDHMAKAERAEVIQIEQVSIDHLGNNPLALSTDAIPAVIASPGLAVGAVFILAQSDLVVNEKGQGVELERGRLEIAIAQVGAHLAATISSAQGPHKTIAEAHQAIVADGAIRDAAERALLVGASAEHAWRMASREQEDLLASLDDSRMRERTIDLRDVERRVLRQLTGAAGDLSVPHGAILICDDIEPSTLMAIPTQGVAGICTARGGATSHAAILAAARSIPMLVAAGEAVLELESGSLILLDAYTGNIDPAPSADAIAEVVQRIKSERDDANAARAHALNPCVLQDGSRVEVFANLATIDDAHEAVANGAEGCGLLRTEFLFAKASQAPSEAEQQQVYKQYADILEGRPLIIRTIDVGGDKPIAYLPFPEEANPALGMRGIRFALSEGSILRTQLRAMLRAVPAEQLRIMLPMIIEAQEIEDVRALVTREAADIGVSSAVQIGIMVETPAAALSAAQLAMHSDFLSIGTNDLSQYVLAMDRGNAALASRVDSFHPAVLRAIQLTAEGAASYGRWLGICGGLASDFRAAPLLVGLGCDELSSVPAAIPKIKQTLGHWTLSQCRDLATKALALSSATEVRKLVSGEVH
jgi:phosphoenolpyruvate-protein phosphotransferase